jgi:hypothetical protein
VIAYEDRRGLWWEYMPSTGKLHNLPWLSTDFHYEDRSGYRRLSVTGGEAKRLIGQGVGRPPDDPLAVAHAKDVGREPDAVLG